MSEFICSPTLLDFVTRVGWFVWNTGLWRQAVGPIRDRFASISEMVTSRECVSEGCGYQIPAPPGAYNLEWCTATEPPSFGPKGRVESPEPTLPPECGTVRLSEMCACPPPEPQPAPAGSQRTDMDQMVNKLNEVKSKVKGHFSKLTDKFGR
eukprot:Gregarina_sp_Pseudo_9__5385@NODE_654_length_2421_cov_135_202351_g617_i0_p3_GENE_NODE_654_length_2421_cov_135_202351_g617_i0NODE_654_length_2421_cov_135_202351_g617_i0_p3_ORF_typecomplete_len152_score16_70DUF3756/PF12581_8/0_1DUF3756/PF12581_8/1_6e04_NODE_654_length_2421_cov_135_202351_g617_i0357812